MYDIATSPVFNPGPGSALHAIVLRASDPHKGPKGNEVEYVVHNHFFYREMGTSAYSNGDYFRDFQKAFARFQERSTALAAHDYPLATPFFVVKKEQKA